MGVMLNAWKILPFPTQAGQVGGHEGVGSIVKLGPGTEGAGVKLGDRVGIKWMAGICEACEPCRAGMDANCFNGVSLLIRSPGGVEMGACVLTRAENLRVLHAWHVSAVCPRACELRHSDP